MLDTDTYTNRGRLEQSDGLRRYNKEIRGVEAKRLAQVFKTGAERKAKNPDQLKAEAAANAQREAAALAKRESAYAKKLDTLLRSRKYKAAGEVEKGGLIDALGTVPQTIEEAIRRTEKYQKASQAEREQMISGKRKEGGANDVRTIQRWFTSSKEKIAILPGDNKANPKAFSIVGKSRLDTYFANGGAAGDKMLLRVLLAQGLTQEGIEREPITGGDTYTYEEGFSTLAEALVWVLKMELQEQGTEAHRTNASSEKQNVFGMARGWIRMTINGSYGNWIVTVTYEVIPSDEIGTMEADREDANKAARAKAYGEQMAPTDAQEAKWAREAAAREMKAAFTEKTPSVAQLLTRLEQFGFLKEGSIQAMEPGAIRAELGEYVNTWHTLARLCSCVAGGRWFGRNDGLTWVNGKQTNAIMSEAAWRNVKVSRQTIAGLPGVGDMARTVPALARQLLEWVMPFGDGSKTAAHRYLTAGQKHGYLSCAPGEYKNAVHYDVKGYYHDLVSRADTPQVTIEEGQERPVWGNRHSPAAVRWREAMKLIKYDKSLRNTLIGCMGTGGRKTYYWAKGARVPMPAWSTDFAPLGLLVVRSGWEITRLAAVETDSVLSVTDCVITSAGKPATYSRLGLNCEPKHEGEAVIYSPTTFRVGPRETIPYQNGDRARLRLPHAPAPATEYYKFLT